MVRWTSEDFCRLLITFANSLDADINGLYSDQDRQNVGSDLNPNR